MRLSVTMVAQDNAKYGYRDALQELKYCGFDVPERKEITNENIRFYAWLCRIAVSMLKLKDCEIKRLEAEQPKKGHWIDNDDPDDNYFECSVCGELWVLIDGTPKDNGMIYCPHCGARMDGGQE